MLGSPAGPGGPAHRGLWPVAPPSIQSATNFTPDGFYSFLPGSPAFGSTLYSHSSAIGRLATATIQPTPGTAFHPAHKDWGFRSVSESLFASTGYTFGAPTPPPGSPYSPVPVTHLDVLAAKGFNSNIIIQQHPEYPPTPPKKQLLADGGKPLALLSADEAAATPCCKKTCCSCSSSAAMAATSAPGRPKQMLNAPSGCSRTNPVNWNLVAIKKEPGGGGGSTPCQVAEVTTSGSPNINATIKVEVASPTQKTCVSNVCHEQLQHCGMGALPTVVTSNGNIPVGIAVARQRKHQEVMASPSLSPMPCHSAGLLTTISAAQIKNVARISELDAADMGASTGAAAGVVGGGGLLQCPPEERSGGFAGWPVGGTHSSALATPTLWQYPAHLPMEPLVPMPMPPVGFQLVRDHNTGGLLLLPTAGVEQVQQVVWPSYHQPPSHVLLPPSLPPPPLQLLSSSADYLASSTTMHHHQQTHSARLLAVTTDKRKLPLPIPTTTFIKIESELSQHKAAQTVSAFDSTTAAGTTVYTDPSMGPLVTTHVIYQHPPNLILSQNAPPAPDLHATTTTTTTCRSQATSPVTCLTPPPDCTPDEELSVQDASNQTDASECEAHEETAPPPPPPVVDHKLSNSVPDTCILEQLVPSIPPAPPEATPPHQEANAPETTKEEQVGVDTKIMEAQIEPTVFKDDVVPVIPIPTCNDEVEIKEDKPVLFDQENDEAEATCSPDLSGLELLSNSIEEFENAQKIDVEPKAASPCCIKTNDEVLERIAQMTLDEPSVASPANDELGGLDLLCALAEQRILEEVNSTMCQPLHVKQEHPVRKAEKHKLECDPLDVDLACETQAKQMNISDKPSDVNQRDSSIKSCTCREDSYRTYTTKESEEEAKKFLASRSQASCCNSDWPCMNAMELDMRMRLADLQRKYREKQRELSKLRPKRNEQHHHHRERFRCKKKTRKKSTTSNRSTPPPVVPPLSVDARIAKVDPSARHTNNNCMELLKPPKLCTYTSGAENVSFPIRKRYSLDADNDVSYKSSKKRKVGRPKKLMSTSGLNSGTETIVAKKLKKGNLVGYLLAAKEKLIQNNSVFSDPPRFVDDGERDYRSSSKSRKSFKVEEDSEVEEEDIVEDSEDLKEKGNESERLDYIEFKKEYDESEVDDEEETHSIAESNQNDEELPSKEEIPSVEEDAQPEQAEEEEEQTAEVDCRCQLTTEHLEEPKLRVLTAMGGLFYAGRLNAVQPPDVYSITLDGERGNRPHIMSREEILRDAILEVSPATAEELPPGTRLCAYWSQQYRCLYPGTVAELDGLENDARFVSVEFDDGDSGRIAIEDIRLLPVDYPIIEYDPNPLLSLSKKRRRTSTVEERRTAPPPLPPPRRKTPSPPPPPTPKEPEAKPAISNQVCPDASLKDRDLQSYKERRRLKKKKRNKFKQKLHDERKKRKKHKYPEENGGGSSKHRKHHKKHHKHKKHHHKKSAHERKKSQTADQIEAESVEDGEPKYEVVIAEVEEHVSDVEVPEREVNEDVDEVTTIAEVVPSVDDEVTMDDILEARTEKNKKFRDRQESCESRSKMSAFLPARQLWGWSGKGYKRPRTKGRSRKQFYRAIQRGKETIQVGDSAVFLSTGRPDRPYIGKIEAMWESCGTMVVKVKWFYHPEETVGCPSSLKYPGALFESPHMDENDVQTISHKCEVLPLNAYTDKLGDNPKRYATIYDNNDIYYLAGYYDPTTTTLKMEADIPFDRRANDDE